MKVVVGASSFADANDKPLRFLEEKGIEVVKNPFGRRLTEEEIIEHLQGATGLLAGLEPLNKNVFEKCPELKVIARIGIGMDNVDADAAGQYGIKVSNTPEGPTEAVAEMTLTTLLTMIHNVIPTNTDVHNSVWKKRIGKSINELKVFVIGYGHIGKRVAKVLSSVGADVMVYDKYISEYPDDGIKHTDYMEEGLKWAEAVTMHVSGKEEVIGRKELALLQDGAYLLNSARGAVVNEDALFDALQTGIIAGFWGDALWKEPYEGKISKCSNAILTPHICTYTVRCRESMEMQAAKNLIKDLSMS